MTKKKKLTQHDIEMLIDDRNFPGYLDWVRYSKQFTREALGEAGVLKGSAKYIQNRNEYADKYLGNALVDVQPVKVKLVGRRGHRSRMVEKPTPFIRYIEARSIDTSIIEVFNELGYHIYIDPSQDEQMFWISNVVLTWGWLKRNYRRYGIGVRWFKDTTLGMSTNDFGETLQELNP